MKNNMPAWEIEIRILADDFMIDKKVTARIINQVKKDGYCGDSAYNKAWKKLFDLM